MLSPSPPPVREQRLSFKLISGNNENAVRLRVWNIYYTQIAPTACLSDGYSRPFISGSILPWILQRLANLSFVDLVVIDM
jgi:hypothetical protein